MLKAIIFDFDGVILESVDIKTEAFASLFADRPEHVADIVDLHVKNMGMSRFEKFKIIYDRFLNEPLDENTSQDLSRRFSDLVFDRILNCSFVPGALEFLDQNNGKYQFYIVSATPQDELRKIVELKGLGHFFQGVFGADKDKGTTIAKILTDNMIAPDEALYIGDAMSDYNGAKSAGTYFIGRVHSGSRDVFDNLSVQEIMDLTLLNDYLAPDKLRKH